MSNIARVLVLLGVLALSVGCSKDKASKKEAPKQPETTITIPDTTPPVAEEKEVATHQVRIGYLVYDLKNADVQAGELNNHELAKRLEYVMCSGNRVRTVRGLLNYENINNGMIDAACTALFYITGNEWGTTVGIGEKNDGSSELLISRVEGHSAVSFNLLFHPDKNNRLNLTNIVELLNYFSELSADTEYPEGYRTCWNNQLLNIKCEGESDDSEEVEESEVSDESVITSLAVTQFRNVVKSPTFPLDSINVNIQWETENLDLASINIKLFEGSNVDGTNYKSAGHSRNFYIFGLKPKTDYRLRIEAVDSEGVSSVRLHEFRTRRL